MKKERLKRFSGFVVAVLTALTASGQCRYYNTYEDFLNGQWEPLDTVYCNSHSKSHQMWWGGNDYQLSTGNDVIDKKLKKDAFIVMRADTMYINCRNLQYEKTRFGNGYTRAVRIGERSLLFVNKIIGRDAMNTRMTAGLMFGAVGGIISASKQAKQQVCYVISGGADKKGLINIRLIDDALMDQMIIKYNDLRDEYYAEEDTKKRILATHIVPILEKAGLFNQYKVVNQ